MCLAAVLFLSNIEFLASSVGGVGEAPDSFTDGVIIDDEYPLHTGTKLPLTLQQNYSCEPKKRNHSGFSIYKILREC